MIGVPAAPGGNPGPAEAMRGPDDGGPVFLLLFRLGQRWFAMDARSIDEVALRGSVTRVPMAPSHIVGVTSLRGRLVAVVSLEQMLGGAGAPSTENTATLPRLVVVREGDYELAVVADAIGGLLDQSTVRVCSTAADASELVREEFDWNGARVALFDRRRLVGVVARLAGAPAALAESEP